MAKYNQGRSVHKSDPEEQAVISNIASLINELQSLSAAGGSFDDGEGGDDGGQQPVRGMASAAMSADGRSPAAPQEVTRPEAGPKNAGLAGWDGEGDNNEEVKKALRVLKAAGFEMPEDPKEKEEKDEVEKALRVLKGIVTSNSEGPTANETGEERVEDAPETDEENEKEVAKALARILGIGGTKARKSMPTSRLGLVATETANEIKVLKSQLAQQSALLHEVFEGMGVTKALEDQIAAEKAKAGNAGTRVAKSQGGRAPVGEYGNDLGEIIGMSVAKAMQPFFQNQQSQNLPANWNRENDVQKNMGQAVLGLGEVAGNQWGQRYSAIPEKE